MTRYALVLAAVLLGAPAIAQEVDAPVDAPVDSGPIAAERDPLAPVPPPVAAPRVQECEGERFVFAWGAGSRPTRVTLCSEKGATTEEIIAMLQDAASTIEDSSLPEDRRTAIALQIRGKITELRGKGAVPPTRAPPPASVSSPVVVPAPVTPPVRSAPLDSLARTPAAPVAALAKPKVQFDCQARGEIRSGGPCTLLDRDTRLTVRAVEALPAGTSLRFTRGGSDRAEVALGTMAKGQSTTLALPSELCAGVFQARVEFRVVSGGQMLDRAGPFRLRC